jgi:hypothetical protein
VPEFPEPTRASGPRNRMNINNFSTRYPSMSGVIFDPANCGVASEMGRLQE